MELWLQFVYALWSWGVEKQMLIFSSSLIFGRVKGSWNTIPKLTIVLVWKTPACLKFGETSNRAVENLRQIKLWAAHDAREEFDPTELRRAGASSETIDLRTLEVEPDKLRGPSTTSERVTHLHIPVPANNSCLSSRVPSS